MSKSKKDGLDEFHKKIAVETNNGIWPVLDKNTPSQSELEDALDMAHTSRYHWGKIGKPINLARADYMISRVYSAMGWGASALFYAKRCLKITQKTGIGDWDLGFAYEALTRAYAVLKDQDQYQNHHDLTIKAIAEIKDPEDKQIVQGEFDKIQYK